MRSFRNYFLLIVVVIASSCGSRKHTTTSASSKGIEEKYAHVLGVNKENIFNKKLYAFIDEWQGTPYKYGGKSKKGIDCSGFTIILYKEVFGKEIRGSSSSLYDQCKRVSKKELKEGDLVFFKIDSKDPPAGRAGISHIGIYLQNNKFVHATTKAGVMIDDLDEEYYQKYFEGGGRLK